MATRLVERDPLDALGLKLISSDNHINEPRDLFTSRFPAHLKDKAPRVVRGADGGDGWSINGELPKRTYGLEAMAGYEKKDYRASGLRYEQLRRGNYDGHGTYASVCYPGMGPSFYVHPDKEVAAAGFHAYKDWILDRPFSYLIFAAVFERYHPICRA